MSLSSWFDSLTCLSMSAIDEVHAETREKAALEPSIQEALFKEWIIKARQKNNRASLLYLATCHRIELYGYGLDLNEILNDWKKLSGDSINHFKTYTGEDCLRHWIRVCCSLESEVLGETQITGQMKDAFDVFRKNGFLFGPLDRFSQRVLAASKKIRNTLPFSEGTVSVAHVAVDGLFDFFEDLNNKSALVVGAGPIAHQGISRLIQKGIKEVLWINRTQSKIQKHQFPVNKVKIGDYKNLYELVWKHSISYVATSSHYRLIEKDKLFSIKKTSNNENTPKVILDLGLPRNVEQEINGHSGFFVRDVDEFSNIAQVNQDKRNNYNKLANKQIEYELIKIRENTRSWSQTPLITELIELINDRKEADLERFQVEKNPDIDYITGNIYSNLLHGILKEVERLDSKSGSEFLQNIIRAWRQSGKWQRGQKVEQKIKVVQ